MISVAKSAQRMSPSFGVTKDLTTDLPNALRVLLADAMTLNSRALNARWNVTGLDFPAYNSIFEDMSWTLSSTVDTIAQALRTLGYPAPLLLTDVIALRSIAEPTNVPTDALSLSADLLDAFNGTIASANAASSAAAASQQTAIADAISEQIERVGNWIWKLNAATNGS